MFFLQDVIGQNSPRKLAIIRIPFAQRATKVKFLTPWYFIMLSSIYLISEALIISWTTQKTLPFATPGQTWGAESCQLITANYKLITNIVAFLQTAMNFCNRINTLNISMCSPRSLVNFMFMLFWIPFKIPAWFAVKLPQFNELNVIRLLVRTKCVISEWVLI